MATGGDIIQGGDQDLLALYLREAESIISKCRELHHIKGINKLEKKCRAELKYLMSVSNLIE